MSGKLFFLFIFFLFVNIFCGQCQSAPDSSSASPTTEVQSMQENNLVEFWTGRYEKLYSQMQHIHEKNARDRKSLLSDYLECLHVLDVLNRSPEPMKNLDWVSVRDAVLNYSFQPEIEQWLDQQKNDKRDRYRNAALLLNAKSLELQHDYTGALACYETLIQTSKNAILSAHVRHLAATAYLHLDNQGEARRQLSRILTDYPNYVWIREVRKRLASIA